MKEIRFNEISLLPGLDRINLAKFRYRILSLSWHSLPAEICIASPVVGVIRNFFSLQNLKKWWGVVPAHNFLNC